MEGVKTVRMSTFGIILEQLGLFVIYIIVGVILVKTTVLTKDTLETISRFVLKLALPVMIFANTVDGVVRETLFQSVSILGLTILFYLITFGAGRGLAFLFRIEGETEQVFRALSMFGNIGFMGIPIVTSLFPEKGMLYISVFTIIDQLVLWTVGVKLTTPSGEGKFDPWKLVNPCTAAVILALALILAGVRLPFLLNTALQRIGATATPLAMIYLGGVFACIDIREYIRRKEFFGIVTGKMILLPLLFYLFLGVFSISEEIRVTMSLLMAMPSMSSLVMMAKANGGDGDYAMGGIFVTTICSLVSIPIVSWILQNL